VIDDCCPESSGDFVTANCSDPRITILKHAVNQGVGGAVISGYQAAVKDGIDIVVKIDGDGQMDPKLIPNFVAPIIEGKADYTKGNRFFDLEQIRNMPKWRLIGNTFLSFLTKLSSGYWNIFDPTNGYTAIHRNIINHLYFHKISRRYFFETDILFRLNIMRAVVIDIPMHAKYDDEISNLKISKVMFEFFYKNIRNLFKRIFYNYYLRDMSLASFELPCGVFLFLFGAFYGLNHWIQNFGSSIATPSGTVMLASLPILVGVQLILAFVGYDVSTVPRQTIHLNLGYYCLKRKQS
jgi:hypothetical protein